MRWMDLEWRLSPLTAVASLVVWLFFGIVLRLLTDAFPLEALIFGLVAVLLYWLSVVVHQLGHSMAARMTGHPMRGVRVWLLGTSLYPADEGSLPAEAHIRRALGGPVLSIILAIVALLIALIFGPDSRMIHWTAICLVALNVLIFGLGALLPISIADFNSDGATILHWLRQRRQAT